MFLEKSILKDLFKNKVSECRRACQRFYTIKQRIPSISLLGWLKSQTLKSKFFWIPRNSSYSIAAAGKAFSIKSLECVPKGVTLYGGRAFDNDNEKSNHSKEWQPFPQEEYFLPRFEIEERGGVYTLSAHVLRDAEDAFLKDLEALEINPSKTDCLLQNYVKEDIPVEEEWKKNVASILSSIKKGEYEKLVLARRAILSFSKEVCPFSLLQAVQKKAMSCFHFLYTPDSVTTFLGSSPELLYRRVGNKIYSEAVAGTRGRGKTPDDDIELSRALLTSSKDLKEHAYVHEDIKRVFEKICSRFEDDKELSLIKRKCWQHLYRKIKGVLENGITDADIITALHPTPAVGGLPKAKAKQEIARIEGFQRGRYAAPIGCVSSEKAEFAVAIRSALVYKNRATLYSGVGIVEESQADEEWCEVEMKTKNFLEAIRQ